MTLKTLLLLALCVISGYATAVNHNFDPRVEGEKELQAKRYNKAYRIWWPAAQLGDPLAQESIALLLYSPHGRGIRVIGDGLTRRELALQFLYRSALNGQATAMQRLSQGAS